MYLKPCRNCPHNIRPECELKAEKRRRWKGLGLTSVNFKCDKRLSLLGGGQRVEFRLDSVVGDLRLHGTVMRSHGTKLLVWVDDNDDYADCSNHNPIVIAPNRLTPLDGALVPLCTECQQPEDTKPWPRDDKGNQTFFCPKCAGWTYKGRDEWGLESWVEPPAEAATAATAGDEVAG